VQDENKNVFCLAASVANEFITSNIFVEQVLMHFSQGGCDSQAKAQSGATRTSVKLKSLRFHALTAPVGPRKVAYCEIRESTIGWVGGVSTGTIRRLSVRRQARCDTVESLQS
jgi:hypothetical protein